MKSSYAGYASCSQSIDLKYSVKPISDFTSRDPKFSQETEKSLALDQMEKQRHPGLSLLF